MGTIILQQITHQCQVAQRLAHLLAFLIDHPGMHPETSEGRFPREVFRLRNLAGMMWKGQVSTTTMNIQLLTKIAHRHCTALNMPPWPSWSPWARPRRFPW